MMDSYCDLVMQYKSGNSVPVLPGGMNREEFASRMDILIREMFAPFTDYSEAEYRCGKALLLLIKKYCLSKKALGGLQPEKDFSDYLTATMKMIDDELERLVPDSEGYYPVIDADKAFTIITNCMQLLTSVMLVQNREKEKKNAQVLGISLPFMVEKSGTVRLARDSVSIGNIIPYLDEVYDITGGFEKARKTIGAGKAPYQVWTEFKYLKSVLELTKCKLDEIGVF